MLDINREEIPFDLDNNKPIEGDYFVISKHLVDIVLGLINNGYKVIDSHYPDTSYIYLKETGKEIPIIDNDLNSVIKDENKEEYRRICEIKDNIAICDVFSPRKDLYLDFAKDTRLPILPEGFEVVEMEDRLRLKKSYDIVKEKKEISEIRSNNEVFALSKWVSEITGKPLEKFQSKNNDVYGNSYYLLDKNTNKEVDTTYMFCDPLIVPTIMVLRDKGYKTVGCCSGHFDHIFIQDLGIYPLDEPDYDKKNGTWVVLLKETPIPYFPDGVKNYEEAVPVEYQSQYIDVNFPNPVKKEDGLYKSSNEIKEEVLKSNKKMLEWANSLPYYKKNTLS